MFQNLYSLSRILTIILVIVAVVAISMTAYIFEENAIHAYGSEISYEIQKVPTAYDYSCDTNSTEVYVTLTNNGDKTVSDLTINVTNPVCVGAVPSNLPSVLNKSSSLSFTVSSTDTNGTITVAGNYTMVTINF